MPRDAPRTQYASLLSSLPTPNSEEAIIGDVLDKMGYLHCFLPPRVRALREDMILAGRAMPVLEVDLAEDAPSERKPFGLMLEALDDLKAHEVYVAAGASAAYAVCRWDGGRRSMRGIRRMARRHCFWRPLGGGSRRWNFCWKKARAS